MTGGDVDWTWFFDKIGPWIAVAIALTLQHYGLEAYARRKQRKGRK